MRLLSPMCRVGLGSVISPSIAGCSAGSGGACPLGYPIPCWSREGISALLTVPGEQERAFLLPKVQGSWAHFPGNYPHLQKLPFLSPSATVSSNLVRCCHQLANTSCLQVPLPVPRQRGGDCSHHPIPAPKPAPVLATGSLA